MATLVKVKTAETHRGDECWCNDCKANRRPGKFTCEDHNRFEDTISRTLSRRLTASFNSLIFGKRRAR